MPCKTCEKMRKCNLRGCCVACYEAHRRAVKAGATTWEQLEKDGKTTARVGKKTWHDTMRNFFPKRRAR